MSGDKHHISNAEEYRKYLEGSMSPKERHAFEKKMLDDEFESEAMDGLSTLKPDELEADLDALKAQLNVRDRRKLAPVLWRAAAAVTLLAAFSFAIYFVLSVDEGENIAQSKKTSPPAAEAEDTQSIKADSLMESAFEQDSSTLLSYNLKAEEAQQNQFEANEEAEAPVTEQIQLLEVADEEEIIDEIAFSDGAPAARVAEADQSGAEDIAAAELPTIEKEETMEMPLEIEPEGKAKKSIASESVPPTEMDQSNFIARIKDVRTVSGKITSEDDNTPVPGVNVIVRGGGVGTITDIEGNYSIEVPEDEDVTLVYSYIGLITEEVQVEGQDSIDISMESDLRQLSEVIVTKDMGRRSKSERQPSTPAGPIGGNAAFEEFVNENIRYPDSGKEEKVKGTVRLVVTVYPNGKITNIEVTKSLGEEFDQEAIRLVRESPGWEAATEDGQGLTSKIKVKIRFKPPE